MLFARVLVSRHSRDMGINKSIGYVEEGLAASGCTQETVKVRTNIFVANKKNTNTCIIVYIYSYIYVLFARRGRPLEVGS